MAVEFVDFAKEAADRQTAVTQAEKGQFDFEAEKKAYANKQASMKDISGLLKGYAEEDANAPKTPAPTDAGPGGYDPATQTTGEDRQAQASFKDQMAAQQIQGQSIQKQAQRLNQMMLAAAKNIDPETALNFRAQLDGLEEKYRANQKSQMALQTDQAEFQGRVAQGYLANPTDEEWYNVVRECMKAGIPGAEQMLTVPKDKREAVAKAAIAQSMSTKDQATAALNAAKLKEKSQEFYDGLEVKRMIADNTNRNAALSREIRLDQLELSKGAHNIAAVNAMLGKVTNRLTQAKEDYQEADTEFKEASNRKKDIEANIIIIKDKEERKKQLAELDDTIAKANTARNAAKSNRDTLNTQFDKLSTMAFPELGGDKTTEDKPAPAADAKQDKPGEVNPAVSSRFKADADMKGRKLGKRVVSGKFMGQYEVLDSKGKVIGYYE